MSARVFISYSHKDEALRDELEVHLAMLKRQGLIDVWHDRRLTPGDHLDDSVSRELDDADIVLLLLSPDFLASDYCYKIEKAHALERHREGTARVISVVLRPCDWTHTDLGRYVLTPKDAQPITRWPDKDEAFLDVTQSIRRAIEEIGKASAPASPHRAIEPKPVPAAVLPRSSNLRLKKQFSDADRDAFREETFEFLAKFFEGSLEELQKRNDGIEGRFRRVDSNKFTAAIYRTGTKISSCTVRLGGMFGGGIAYAEGDNARDNTSNEELSVENDDQSLFLKPMGMSFIMRGDSEKKLTQEGAAELYWSMLIQRLQGSQR
ncbi:toll/interleukin-1 receptor domain-containing protein [Parvularcula flava]|uniref:Toll/interleukin-1 receptor domain-containing protein n=1 Tax=Aquisalinus luteolus TaxID=1566827 RepID=A0A8J3A4G1_9PROT|nr:toll/interleukin-1 receptor domain-containing protein [Aquisalinus luteolus]NHK29671.1 toll/interleukin-1 receptor domain-containing protein [Aquisalinus luteolus]GGI02153.1 hypothetical protein GCM10011355_34480 [Aquisalinus luteolus]